MNYSRVPIKHYEPESRVRSLDIQTLVPYTLEEVTAEASRCLGCGLCIEGCPARIDVPGFQIAVRNGNLAEGLKINFEKLPFVGVCGNVCPPRSLDECVLDDNKGPVATRHIKRFISDNVEDYRSTLGVVVNDLGGHPRVAIIGGGPSGLSTAFYLSINGIQVDVYEQTDRPGGMMVHGIPDFRLSRSTVQKEADHVLSYGAHIYYNKKIGRDIKFEDLLQKYDAVYIAIGNWRPSRTRTPGADLKGVYHALDFLGQINNGHKIDVGDTVAIIGGGFTAFDAARISLRSGAKKVIVMYRRAVTDRPGYPSSNAEEELEEAEEEKVEFMWEVTPIQYYGVDGKVKGIKYWKNQMVDTGKGRREPVPIKDKEYSVEVDTVVEATGQKGDLSFIPEEIMKRISLTPSGDVIVNQYNMTTYPGIFAGGDVTNARKDIISGVADSGRASMGILFYFKETGKIEKVPAKLVNFESGPYAENFYA
ncbi:MAG: FAD-dependent oxidoreductase [Candidatus Thermoplasmatota archaeon]|nr:FAD-dependent oxidoreductase [Candidatus Thermoplasmatota archaeon]